MITQTIRTSKYTTTIDIPAQKLHTKAKFIQISKNPRSKQEEIISIPNVCYEQEKQKRQMGLQTKSMIEQLQQAYNQDVKALEDKINSLKTGHDIEKLKLQHQIDSQRKQLNFYRKRAEQSQIQANSSRSIHESKLSKLQVQVQNKNQALTLKSNQIENLIKEIKQLRKQNNQKNALLSSKFKEFQTQKDKKFMEQKRNLQKKIEILQRQKQATSREFQRQIQNQRTQNKHHLLKIQSLERQNLSLKQEIVACKKEIEFQTGQIQTYMKNLKDLQNLKSKNEQTIIALHQKIEQQNDQIQILLEQMKQQRIFIETSQGLNGQNTEEGIILRDKLNEYAIIIEQKEKQVVEHNTQYLIKLKEIDQEKQNTKKVIDELSKTRDIINALNQQIKALKQQNQHIKTQLANKIVQYNELLNRPPEHFDVKIQKTIDKKQYIEQLQSKVQQLEAIVDQLRQDNSSYIEQIKKKVNDEQKAKKREQQLLKSNQQLKEYIDNREKSIGWAVQRQIMKDVQISRHSSEKSQGYKVFVKSSQSQSESIPSHSHDVSHINKGEGINFSVESKLQNILDKKQYSSVIEKPSSVLKNSQRNLQNQ